MALPSSAIISSTRGLGRSLVRAISSSTSAPAPPASPAGQVAADKAPEVEKPMFDYKDALNLECRLTEEEVRSLYLCPGKYCVYYSILYR